MAAIDTHPSILLIAFIVISVLLAMPIAWLFIALRRFQRRYENIAKTAEAGNLAELVVGLSHELGRVQADLARMEEAQSDLGQNLSFVVQKIGLIRFDAFEDVGGKLSFAAALLDNRGDGLIISSINGRQENRVYAKPVQGGASVFNLSIEEKEAIGQALA